MKKAIAELIIMLVMFIFLSVVIFSYVSLGFSKNGEIIIHMKQFHNTANGH